MSTKKLAKELGLLRQRSQSLSGSKKTVLSNQIFSYLIVIDFESTCWRERNNYSQEIIEFPAVLLNTSTGEIESEFHTYVQPQEHPVLSKFCTELTGITQMQVEAGIPLQICLSQFSRWLQNLQLEMGLVFPNRQQICSAPSPSQKLCTFLTWSDWDLGVCLQYECKRKQLNKPEVLNSWIDLRSTYRLFYNRKPKGLNGALQDLGILFSGREHSGLDDSRNTAKLSVRMMRDGCVMKITRSLERTPVVKPRFGNTTTDEKEKPNTNKTENALATSKPSSSKIPQESCQIKSCPDTKEISWSLQECVQTCQSLISPKTVLNGSATPPWGPNSSSSVKTVAASHLSSSVMINCPSKHNNNNSLVLCSTTVGCLPKLPQAKQLSETGATVGFVEEEERIEPLVEIEDRWCPYDDVVLESDDAIDGRDGEYISDFDSGCYVWEEPDNSHSTRDLLTLRHETSAENNSQTEMSSDLPTKIMASHDNVSDGSEKMRQHLAISEPDVHFAVPKTVTWGPKTNQQKTVLKTVLQFQDTSDWPRKTSEKNTSSPFRRPESFVPEKTSTPNTSFARPKPGIKQHTKPRETPKSFFTIYTDQAKRATAPSRPSSISCLDTPKNVLSHISTNTMFSLTSHSFIPVKHKEAVKITSPLCACGRRAKRQVVSNGGPNHRRGFYCCPVRRSGSGGKIQKGCAFFKWESSLINSSTVAPVLPARSSISLCHINSNLNHPPPHSTLRKSC